MAFFNFFVASIGLVVSINLAHGSLFEMTSSIMKENLPSHIYDKFLGNTNQAFRFKREVVTKNLDDPNGCIAECSRTEMEQTTNASKTYAQNLVPPIVSVSMTTKQSTPEEYEAFKKKIQDLTFAHMGLWFADLCTIEKQTTACAQKCPASQLRTIFLWNMIGSTDTMCDAGNKTWNNYTEYFTTFNCSNNVKLGGFCDHKCHEEIGVKNVTGPFLFNEKNYSLQYETDSKKNTAAVGPACKNILCHMECYKKLITYQCGSKAYDMYTRLAKIEPRFTLNVLKLMNAVDQNGDCKEFQQ